MDIIDKFSSNLKTVLTRALCFAVETHEQTILAEHLFWALGTQKGCIAAEILKKTGVTQTDLKKITKGISVKEVLPSTANGMILHLSDDARRAVEKAVLTANKYGHRYIGTEHLLSGLIQTELPVIKTFLQDQQIDLVYLNEQLSMVLKNTSLFPEMTSGMKQDQSVTETKSADVSSFKELQPQKFQALSYFARELTSPEIQKKIDPVIGRDQEIERVMEILCRRTKNNPLLVGEPGVGKTAVVEGLAKCIFEKTVPQILQNKRVFSLDLALLVAGTMYRGEFEGRLRQLIDEVRASDDVLLFIDELHTIVGAGSASGSMDAANILKPALARGDIHCIGATTQSEFKKHIETDSALERRFQTVTIEEPNEQATIEILQGIAPHYESFHGVRISPDAIEHAVKLSVRYITDRRLPDKAIDLIDEASASARMRTTELRPQEKRKAIERHIEQLKNDKQQAVTEERFLDAIHLKATEDLLQHELDVHSHQTETLGTTLAIDHKDIAGVISRMLRIPLDDLLSQNQSAFADIETKLNTHILGQTEVVSRVANALKRAKTGIAHPARPLASFLFLGPSGVGKTELARAVAHNFFSSSKHLIRLDMSEYSEGFTMSKLIGAPAGYIGYREHANLTDRVKQKPYAVVLFDEIEKAHKDVQNLLLQILEEGELADASGKMVNFRNTIVILTSNVGLERFESGGIGFTSGDTETSKRLTSDIDQELKERFRPELLNRIDHTCVFSPLSTDVLSEICRKQLSELTMRMSEQGITLSISDIVTQHLIEKLDPKSGARSVRQLIQTHVESILAEHLLTETKSAKGGSASGGKFTLTLTKKSAKGGSASLGQLAIRKTR